MALTLANFQSLITNKFFVSIESAQEVSDFTGLDSTGSDLRDEATSSNVIVFLPPINKIFARGSYYGLSDTEFNQVKNGLTALEGTVTTLGTNLSTLAALVHTQGNTISDHTTTLASHTSDLSDLADDIADLQRDVAALSPNNQTLTELIEDAVEDALNNKLETALGSSATISNINSSISNINTSLANKAEKEAFDKLCEKIGIQSWVWIDPEQLEPGQTNITIVDQLNTLTQSVSQIPHFAIEVVDTLPVSNISPTTIYLVRSATGTDANNNELFTEYIYVDLDKNKEDPETHQPLPARWGWESLGRQYLNMNNYLNADQIAQIQQSLESSISAIQSRLGDADIAQIATNTSNISTLQSNVTALTNRLNILLDANGNFLLTGSDIKTNNTQGSNTIAVDIASLQTGKLDKNSLQWVIINTPTNNQEPEQQEP